MVIRMASRPDSDTCSTREAAKMLGISVRTAQLWVEEGRLSAWKTPGGHRRILKESVLGMINAQGRALSPAGERFSVLVVEDDPVQRRLLEALIKRQLPDCDLRLANDGFEGLMRIGEKNPDVLVTDLMMPGLDGFRMLGSLNRMNLTRSMQLVVVTSLDDQQIRERGGLPSNASLLRKPVDAQQLGSLIGAFNIVWESKRKQS